jgi:hypothetical protein
VVINDLSARAGDDLDLSQVLNAVGASVGYAELSKTYVSSAQTFTFNQTVVSNDRDAVDPEAVASLIGSLKVEMTTLTNVVSAYVDPNEVQALSSQTAANQSVATDVANAMGKALAGGGTVDATVQAEVDRLLPLFEHNPLNS